MQDPSTEPRPENSLKESDQTASSVTPEPTTETRDKPESVSDTTGRRGSKIELPDSDHKDIASALRELPNIHKSETGPLRYADPHNTAVGVKSDYPRWVGQRSG